MGKNQNLKSQKRKRQNFSSRCAYSITNIVKKKRAQWISGKCHALNRKQFRNDIVHALTKFPIRVIFPRRKTLGRAGGQAKIIRSPLSAAAVTIIRSRAMISRRTTASQTRHVYVYACVFLCIRVHWLVCKLCVCVCVCVHYVAIANKEKAASPQKKKKRFHFCSPT